MEFRNIPNILFVDDDYIFLKSIEIAFSKQYSIYLAISSTEALKILEKEEIDIIVSDYNMPGITGTDLFQITLNKYSDIPRILISAKSDTDFVIESLNKSQLFAFYSKPLNFEQLRISINKAFENKKLINENIELQDQLKANNEQLVELTKLLMKEIEENKVIMSQLSESKEKFEDAEKIAKIGHWQLNITENILLWSDEIYRIFGLEPQEFGATYEAFLDNIHHEDRELVNKAYTNSLKSKQPYEIVHRLLLKNGDIKYVRENCETLYDDNGFAVKSLGTIQDITEIKNYELELIRSKEKAEESETQIKYSQRVARLGYYIFDIKSGLWTSSEMLDEIFGIDKTYKRSVAGWLDIIHPDYQTRMNKYLTDNILTKHEQFNLEYKIVNRLSGKEYWVHGLGNLEFDNNNELIKMFGTIQDITEIKLSHEKAHKFQQIIEQLPVSIVVTDILGNIEYVNPKFTEITGYFDNEVIGKNPRILKSDKTPEEYYSNIWDTILSKKEWRGEFINKKKNGELYRDFTVISAITDIAETITHFIAIKEDITKRKAF